MKITKRQLKRIIKEERLNLLKEYNSRQKWAHPKSGENMLLMMNDLVDMMLNQGVDAFELSGELRGLADTVEDMYAKKGGEITGDLESDPRMEKYK